MPAILHLNLRRKWFAKIAKKTKRVEYRKYTPYWRRRIENRDYDVIHFRNGYATNDGSAGVPGFLTRSTRTAGPLDESGGWCDFQPTK
jgi:hypothetical protein